MQHNGAQVRQLRQQRRTASQSQLAHTLTWVVRPMLCMVLNI